MSIDLLYGLLPEHILLILLLSLMVLEIVRADERIAGVYFAVLLAAGCGVLLLHRSIGYAAVLVPGEIAVDSFAVSARLVVLGCGLLAGICSPAGTSIKSRMLLTSSLLGGLIIMDSAGFVSLFMGIEMLSLPAFALMIHGEGPTSASEGALKYLLLSSVASALILFGVSLAYGATGSLAVRDFASALQQGGSQILAACLLVLCGFFFKAAVFPFHGWAPDAYGSARLPVTAFLSSVVKATVVLSLVRLFADLPLPAEIAYVVAVLSIGSIFYGNVAAIGQGSFRRLLAYSSIAHAGYMMFALTDTTGGRTEALLYYTAVYAVTTLVACASFGLLAGGKGDDLAALDGAFVRRPVPALMLALSALSLAGIPPLPGFLAKLFVFKSVVASGLLLPAVLAFAGSYVGVVYYLGIVLRIFKPVAASSEAANGSGFGWAEGGMLLGTLTLMLFTFFPGVFHGMA